MVVPKIKHLSATLSSLEEKIKLKYACAADALAPLYNAFSWDTFTLLISKVIPQMKFDDFLSVERLADFKQNFGLTIQDEPESTLLGSHSGTFFGYPFIFTEDMNFRWGEKLWCGSRTVSYTVYETDADGKRVARTRTECLTATVTKPCPEFNISRYLFFGHDAAPELSYSREPSSLSGSSGLFAALGRKYRMHKLHKLEQNLTDDSEFTMMSNREFELLYKSENRNHEIGFRLLFTPLAQEYMVKLLKDQSVGYGDDFHLRKSCCVTCLASGHLSGTRIAQAPFSTDLYDLKKIKRLFCSKSGEFFRSIYFSFAPLFLVPIYNEERLRAADTPEKESISESELEGAAAWKSDHYKPEESITDNIFNIRNYRRRGNTVSATVEAIGFRGERRVDIVPCLAGNGKSYNVPVEWIEYIPVTCRTPIHACRENKISPGQKILFRRRGLAFW